MKAEVISVTYHKGPEVLVHVRDWDKVLKLFKEGFFKTDQRGTDYVLRRESEILVKVRDENGQLIEFNCKPSLKKRYGKRIKGSVLTDKLIAELEAKKVAFEKNPKGYYSIVEI